MKLLLLMQMNMSYLSSFCGVGKKRPREDPNPLSTGINANEIFELVSGSVVRVLDIHPGFIVVLCHNFVIV